MGEGKVIGGDFMDAAVGRNWRGVVALSSGLKRMPKLTANEVARWVEVPYEQPSSGRIVRFGKAAYRRSADVSGKVLEAAVDAAFDLPSLPGKAADAVLDLPSLPARAVGAARALPGQLANVTLETAAGHGASKRRRGPARVRVDWVDGKQSLLELPEDLFQHLATSLPHLQIETEPQAED